MGAGAVDRAKTPQKFRNNVRILGFQLNDPIQATTRNAPYLTHLTKRALEGPFRTQIEITWSAKIRSLLATFAICRSRPVDVLSDWCRAYKTYRLNTMVVEQGINGLLVTINHAHDAIRQTSFLQQLGDEQGRTWIALGGLQDEAVTAGNRHRKHPQRHHRREVEWRDSSNYTQRLELTPGIDIGANIFAVFALEQLGHTTCYRQCIFDPGADAILTQPSSLKANLNNEFGVRNQVNEIPACR